MSRIRCLSFHESYACRREGACCTANWPIPIEADRLASLQAALANGRLVASRRPQPLWILPESAPAATPALLGTHDHACVFYEHNTRTCAIHSALGHQALPLACRQFPRVSVTDPGGVSVTLSHYCPTAARLLEEQGPIAIVSGPQPYAARGEYVGLDARSSLPPLLRPEMLMDWDAWWEWERLAVAFINRSAVPIDQLLGELRAIVETVRRWAPGDVALIDRVRAAFAMAPQHVPLVPEQDLRLREVLGAIPDELRPSGLDPGRVPCDDAARRFLAAHAFASWTAHLGQGLRSWWRSIDAAWALLSYGLGVRQTDLLLRHLADPVELARIWSQIDLASHH